jgi:hypothetical protein
VGSDQTTIGIGPNLCPSLPSPVSRSAGSFVREGVYTPPSSGNNSTPSTPANNGGGSPTTRNNFADLKPGETTVIPEFSFFGPGGDGVFNPENVGVTVIPWPFRDFRPIQELVFTPTVPVAPSISRFLFAPLPQTITDALSKIPQIASALQASNITREQDLASLYFKPIELETPETLPPGHFVIKSGQTEIKSSVTYDLTLKTLAQIVKVSGNESLNISILPLAEGEVTATYLDQVLAFTKDGTIANLNITTPANPGRYVLKTNASPIPLIIEVVAPKVEENSKPWGILNFIWEWFN